MASSPQRESAMSSTATGKTALTSLGSMILDRLRSNRAAIAASVALFVAAASLGLVSPWGAVLCTAMVMLVAIAIPLAPAPAIPNEWQPGAADDPPSAAMLEALLEP